MKALLFGLGLILFSACCLSGPHTGLPGVGALNQEGTRMATMGIGLALMVSGLSIRPRPHSR